MSKKSKKAKKKKPVRIKFSTERKTPAPDQPAPPTITPHPTAGPKVTEFEDKLDQDVQETLIDKGPLKRGRGRPRKEPEIEPEFELDERTIAQGIKMPFDLWALSQKLEQLRISDQESQTIAAPIKKLLDYYFPGAPYIVIAWAGLIITSYTIFSPRLKLIAELKKQKQSSTETIEPGQGGPVQSPGINPGSQIEFPGATKPVKI